jgi:large subunit ribosomal protein L28
MRERKCDITGKRKNSKCNSISKKGNRNHRVQNVNLQTRRFWWAEQKKWVRLRIATKTYRTILKLGLDRTARKYKVDLNKFSLSYGKGPTRKPREYPESNFTGTLIMKPRYEKYIQDAIKYNPESVRDDLLPNYVPPTVIEEDEEYPALYRVARQLVADPENLPEEDFNLPLPQVSSPVFIIPQAKSKQDKDREKEKKREKNAKNKKGAKGKNQEQKKGGKQQQQQGNKKGAQQGKKPAAAGGAGTKKK